MDKAHITLRLDQLPLWRLFVALSDAESVAGAYSPTSRALAREIKRRLNEPTTSDALSESEKAKGGGRG